MKKRIGIISVILVFALATVLAGCGGSGGGSEETPAPEGDAAEVESPAEVESSAEEAGEEAVATDVEALEILASCTFQETETGGQILKHFIDKVGELSGGKITVNMNWGGTLFDSAGEFDAVADGAVNLIPLGHLPHIDKVTYLGFPGWAPGGTQGVVEYFNTLMFDDPETSKLVQDEAAEKGIKYLNVIAGGTNAFCANYEFTDLDSLVKGSKSFGNFMAAQFEALGFQVTSVTPPDTYDALNRGLIDSTQMGFAPAVALAWYEVAPYWALDGTYTAGNMFTVNLAWWDGLSAAQQDAIQKAADDTEAYSMTLYDEAITSDIAKVEEATGNKFVEFGEADIAKIWDACFKANADATVKIAEQNGKADGVNVILKKAAEITGATWE
jgi:TRAP-type C4-dicarboxylate transport system substrate-binding protein